ncbi:MAG: Gfo/Idh/MocA family oxidoreductase [Planctomycetales bacterium]|nr:Gfo/Idh/MocA family oxidoreductase [Planctomycetales bacterium]MCA9184022.1 Gfo/Idh/MocA family oxidoreductase [Planctomycetales bacterium]
MSEPVRFGLIGYGLFGKHHAAAIARASNARLAAIAVKSPSSQQTAAADHPSVDVMDDYRRLLDRSDIDAVSIVVPNRLHFQVARDALAAGKHVLLEKPMALSVADCDALIELAEQGQRTLAVGHELRLSSLWGSVRQLIDDGAIGRPLHALIELSRFPYRQGSEGWRYDVDRVGSWILEEPIHFFDLARWYLNDGGEPISVYARANSRDAARPELTDNFSAVVNFTGGAYAVVSQTLAAFGHHQTAKISGSEGTIWAWWSAADARSERPTFGLRYGLGDQVHEVTLDKPAGELLELAEEIEAVAEAMRGGTAPPCTGRDGRWSTYLCLAAEESARSGAIVSLT